VVWIQEDNNGNGLPDEMWYELRGSEDDTDHKRNISRRYALSYFRASEAVINQYGQLIRRVYWVDAKGRTGMIPGGFPAPRWGVEGEWVTYTFTRLGDGGLSESTSGYVDTLDEIFYINKAMRADETPIALAAVRFIKVQTAVFSYGGLFGDTSTEIQYADFLGTQSWFPKPQ
jgi:hypothetical protein